jgi:precorrin-2 dehydrogenase/sirohydrochlorin ferrochelatase
MYPVIFPPARLKAVLVGAGEAAVRRLKGLDAAGIAVQVFSPEPGGVLAQAAGDRCTARLLQAADLEGLEGVTIMLVAGLDDAVSAELAALARARTIPVNVEDRLALCDFHVPAVIRRGGLLLTVSTGGGAPGLASRLRQRLETDFGPEWGDRLEALSQARTAWKAEGADMAELRRRTREWLDQRGWFD